MITALKLSDVLETLQVVHGIKLRSVMIASSWGGEVSLELSSQPPFSAHRYLLNKGFVRGGDPANVDFYVYRPYKRVQHA